MAHVHILKWGGNPYAPEKTLSVDDQGKFTVRLDTAQSWGIFVTAADHANLQFPLIANKAQSPLQLTIHLKPHPYPQDFSDVKITGDWNKFSLSKADAMQRQADGTYLWEREIPADTLSYQLVNATSDGHTVNGTMYDALKYDGGGDYISIIRGIKGKARVIFDPHKLIKATAGLQTPVEIDAANSALQPYMEIALQYEQEAQKARQAQNEYYAKHHNLDGFVYETASFKKNLLDKMQSASDKQLTKFAAVYLCQLPAMGVSVKDSLYKKVVALLPLNDPLWKLSPLNAPTAYRKALGDKALPLFEKTVKQMPYNDVRAALLVELGFAAKTDRQTDKLRTIYQDLKTHHAGVSDLTYFIDRLNPDARIAVGKPLPDYSFKLLNSNKTVSKKSMLGKYYLIDFWAVWCRPCVGEMPFIHQAYAQYKNKNFTVLSLSLDRAPEDIAKFRAEKWKMPWLHVFLQGEARKQASKNFGVRGIPRPILVNPQGIIIAMEGDVRGENLAATLKKILK